VVEAVAPIRDDALDSLFGRTSAVVIGVVRLLPLPGAPAPDGSSMAAIVERAVTDASSYAAAGIDGLIVGIHGDVPFLEPDALGPETPAAMAFVAEKVGTSTGLPMGITVLANCAMGALAASGATLENAGRILGAAHGCIIASAWKVGGAGWNPVDAERCRGFMAGIADLR
jgi:predicted TIM-barrel enzyme